LKKVTIVTSTENESLLLDQLGKARLISFKTIPPSEYGNYADIFDEAIDYSALSNELSSQYQALLELEPRLATKPKKPDDEELKRFATDTEGYVEGLLNTLLEMRATVKENKLKIEQLIEKRDLEIEKLRQEFKDKKKELKKKFRETREQYSSQIKQLEADLHSLRTKAKALEVLTPEEFKTCSAAGVVKTEVIPELAEFLRSRGKDRFKSYEISDDENLLLFFELDDDEKLVEFLFLVYEVVDVFEAFSSGDLLLVLDSERKDKQVQLYWSQVSELESKINELRDQKEKASLEADLSKLDAECEAKIAEINEKYASTLAEAEKEYEATIDRLKAEWEEQLGILSYYKRYLKSCSKNAPLLRNQVITLMQGWVPDNRLPEFEQIIDTVSSKTGEKLYYKIEDPSPEDMHNVPTPKTEMPGFLKNAWILTQLRGWPSINELNPAYISVLVFCFQFGLMFGDIGQGLIYLVFGLALYRRFKRGMMKYLTSLFIPMGMAAIIFGFMYDSIFLNEHLITHWLHEAHIELPFAYPVMPNPIHETAELLNLIFMVGTIEVVFGSILGAYNSIKKGDYVAIIGEHGIGMGLYVLGLYLSAGNMFTEGLDVVAMLGNWPFKIALLGLGLSTIEPILHSVQHGHGIGIDALGEAVGGFLMTFVEGLANMFSFLRLAAFALAHASLAGAALSMGEATGSALGSLVMMNIIALSFEFVSSSVQSLRLLYYEFMGKFFHGEGIPFKPFRVNTLKAATE